MWPCHINFPMCLLVYPSASNKRGLACLMILQQTMQILAGFAPIMRTPQTLHNTSGAHLNWPVSFLEQPTTSSKQHTRTTSLRAALSATSSLRALSWLETFKVNQHHYHQLDGNVPARSCPRNNHYAAEQQCIHVKHLRTTSLQPQLRDTVRVSIDRGCWHCQRQRKRFCLRNLPLL